IIPLSRGKQIIVYSNGTPQFLPVTTGIRDSVYVQVISGVHIGDTVLICGLMSVKPDSQIELSKVQ
ncbi:MAG TPA: efflux RND transporter periplasmic adaptor subunit, partial [Agriterribacter sp.]|nr:efflux RND transporter periplasmic adaptor subunit [Agriterribacter sp.]